MWSTSDSPTSQAHLRQPDVGGWYAGDSLQRYLGHEHLDTTMIYAEVSDPLLRQDYYQGIAALDPGSENLSMSGLAPTQQHTLRQLVEELKTPGLEQSRHDEILDQMQPLLEVKAITSGAGFSSQGLGK